MEDVVSAWALKETEERVPGGADIPGDENSKSEGTETGKPGTSSRNDNNGCRAQRKNGPRWAICNVSMKTWMSLLKACAWLEIKIAVHVEDALEKVHACPGALGGETAVETAHGTRRPGQCWWQGAARTGKSRRCL